jgi:hypothetical protein
MTAEPESITLPGDIAPDLLRECSPIIYRAGGGVLGVVCFFGDHKGFENVPHVCWDPKQPVHPSLRSSIALRLDHETGLQHAIWLLAEANGLDIQTAHAWLEEPGEAWGPQWTLHVGSKGHGRAWYLDSEPESLAHAVRDVCLREVSR